jgi:RNA polymerase sigma-70 factor (ECF subfamily)
MKKPFRKLADTYRDKVFTFAWYSLHSREEAEDVTQEVLVKLWQHAESVDPEKLTAWVMRVARNAVIDTTRRRKSRGAVFADGVDFNVVESLVASGNAGPDQAIRSREVRDALQEALAQVEEPYRSIVVMREVQEMSYSEIVAALEMPLNTVKVYLHRGRRMLREVLRGKV